MDESPCLICADSGVLDLDADLVRPYPYCELGRSVGVLITADQRKDVDKADADDELG